MNLKFDYVKSFIETNAFSDFSAKHGLDSEIVASLCESFATHINLPKEKWFKYHPPIEVNVVKPVPVEEKIIAYNDSIVPTAYIEKPGNWLWLIGAYAHAIGKTFQNVKKLRTKI